MQKIALDDDDDDVCVFVCASNIYLMITKSICDDSLIVPFEIESFCLMIRFIQRNTIDDVR